MPLMARKNSSNPFRFNQRKAIQAVGFLLKLKHDSHKTDNYMRLLKLLYFADRESIKETGAPITGDKFIAMKHGPTLSGLLDFVNQSRSDNAEWDKYIEKNGYEITLIDDPGNGELSRYEINLLRKIWEENRELGEWDVVRKSHDLPEWKKNDPGQSQKPIPLKDVLEAVGRGDCLDDIISSAAEDEAIKQLFGAN